MIWKETCRRSRARGSLVNITNSSFIDWHVCLLMLGESSGFQRALDTTCWRGTRRKLWPRWSVSRRRTEHRCLWENSSLPDRWEPVFVQHTAQTLWTSLVYSTYFFFFLMSVLSIRRTGERLKTCFRHTFAGPQSCCGSFGNCPPYCPKPHVLLCA